MDSTRLTGIGVTLLGVSALSSAATSFVSSTESYSLVMLVGMGIPGLCLTGAGIGILLGKVETTTSGTTSRRKTAIITAIAVVAFAAGALLALT